MTNQAPDPAGDLAKALKADEAVVRAAKLAPEELTDAFDRVRKAEQRHRWFFTPGLIVAVLGMALSFAAPARDSQGTAHPLQRASVLVFLAGMAGAGYRIVREREEEIKKEVEDRGKRNIVAAFKAGKFEI